ncbi:hypothetical protein, conserved, partial [Babesia bigemina]
MDRQIKDVEERLKKLEGSEDRDKGQKTASLNATKSQLEHYKNSCNANHTKYPENPALKDIDSKLSQVKNLKKSLEGLTENDNCEKLLTNLCDGLETFLGFNSESKGYDGTGIVYSDLDRLCDGVMGFLYQVLKDVSEKQPYEAGKTMFLDRLNREINAKLCSGVEGFKSVVDRVVSRVRQYNEKVVESNSKVSGPINELLGRVKNEYPTEIGRIPDEVDLKIMSDEEIGKIVLPTNALTEKCITSAKLFDTKLTKLTKHINDLNYKLRDSVKTTHERIKQETARVEAMSKKERENYDAVIKLVGNASENLKKVLKQKIGDDVSAVVKNLKKRVSDILVKLNNVHINMATYLSQLDTWSNEAEGFVEEAIRKVNDILDQVDNVNNEVNKKAIKAAAAQIRELGFSLYEAGNDAKTKAQEEVTKALAQVKSMNEALKGDLYKVKQAVEGQVTEIKNKIGKLYETVTERPGSAVKDMDKLIESVVKHIKVHAAGIRGNTEGRFKEGLAVVAMKVGEIVNGNYAGENFKERILYAWLTDIVEKNPVKKYIEDYLQYNGDQFVNRGINAITDNVKQHIKDKLNTLTSAGSKRIQTTGNVAEDLNTIKTTLDSFVFEFADKIKSGDIKASDVETKLGNAHVLRTGHSTSRIYLDDAVNSIVNQLLGRAAGASKEIEDLVKSCNFSYVDSAYNKAKNFVGKLEKAIGNGSPLSPGEDGTAKAVDSAITEVTNLLKGKLIPNGGSSVNLDAAGTFTEYNRFVDQDAAKLQSLASEKLEDVKENAGSLPAAIGEIKTKVEEALDKIGDVKDKLFSKAQEVTDNLNLLCKTVKDLAETGDESAKGKLNRLKQKIGRAVKVDKESLLVLHGKFKALRDGDLAASIDMANAFLTEASKLEAECIRRLQQNVNCEVNIVKKELASRIVQSHVTVVKLLLQQFVAKLQSELDKLPAAIEDDKHIGFKGFMEKLYEGFNTNIVPKKDDLKLDTLSEAFQNFCSPLHLYLKAEIGRQNNDNHAKKHPSSQRSTNNYADAVDCVKNELEKLVNQIRAGNRYDYHVPRLLDGLTDAIDGLHPESFSEPNTPLLETIAHGFRGLVSELGKAYVSVYDGARNVNWERENNPETTYCAKIFLTAFSTVYDAVHDLRINCNSLKGHQIHSSSDLGRLFLRHGFKVSAENKQHWELQNKSVINGEYVANRLSFRVEGAKDNEHLKECESNKRKSNVLFNLFDILKCILHHVDQYNAICHIAILPKPRTPCTVFEMLAWLSGLTYTSAYQALLSDGFTNVLDNPDTPLAGDGEISVFDIEQSYLEAHPQTITYKSIRTVLQYLCSKSYDLLTTVVGHGDAATFYACDYSNNTLNLYYPSSGEDCLQMLLDFLRRICSRQCALK